MSEGVQNVLHLTAKKADHTHTGAGKRGFQHPGDSPAKQDIDTQPGDLSGPGLGLLMKQSHHPMMARLKRAPGHNEQLLRNIEHG
jgi:hypothetical protein